MIKYPTGQKSSEKKNSKEPVNFAGRGMNFEDEINRSNDYYREINKAIIYKKPTPIKVVGAHKTSTGSYQIDEAYFMQPSTTDYNGIYKGKYIDFEAKETRNVNLFPFANIHDNQLEHLFKVDEHGGIAFVLVRFTLKNTVYLLDAKVIKRLFEAKYRSIPLEIFQQEGHLVPPNYLAPVDYLKVVDQAYFD